jgi:hypothetical protein
MMIRWYITEMRLLFAYSRDWALKFGVPGHRWLIIPMAGQAVLMATAWLVVSPIVRHPKPPVFKAFFIGRCHAYMLGATWAQLKNRKTFTSVVWDK